MYTIYKCEHNINGDIMSQIDCSVKDCAYCIDGCKCSLEKIQIVKDIRKMVLQKYMLLPQQVFH